LGAPSDEPTSSRVIVSAVRAQTAFNTRHAVGSIAGRACGRKTQQVRAAEQLRLTLNDIETIWSLRSRVLSCATTGTK
jgi:hypothetical protein